MNVRESMILALNPKPTETQIAYVRRGDQIDTSIARIWRAKDVPRCRLCPQGECTASFCDNDEQLSVCLVVALREVSREEAPLFRHGPSVINRGLLGDRPPRLDGQN
jgi:hypothetical protein